MNRIRQLREERHLNQEGLAMQLSTAQSTISFYETEDRLPDLKTCGRIADFFGVSLDYLAGRSEIRNPDAQAHLSDTEAEILARLKLLPQDAQKQVDAFIQGLLASK